MTFVQQGIPKLIKISLQKVFYHTTGGKNIIIFLRTMLYFNVCFDKIKQ